MSTVYTFRWLLYCLLLILLLVDHLFPSAMLAANGVVGTGSPASCTEATFDTAFNAVEASGGGMLTFNCGPAAHTIIFTGQKFISANTVIDGAGLITLSGGNATSLFQVFVNQTLTLRNLTLTRAYGTSGAVENFGRLNLNSSQLTNNVATGSGGAISNYGEVNLTNVVMTNNTAAEGGGGLETTNGATVTISNSYFSGNKTTDTLAEGGAIRSAGALTITTSTFVQNNASRGGAIFVAGGSTNLRRSTLSGNWAAYGGGIRQVDGSLTLTEVTLAGNGYGSNGSKITTGGGAVSWDGGSASLIQVTINGNWASYGGGFDHANGNTTLINVTLSGNAAVGGGAFDQGGGSLALTNVTLSRNAAPFFAGGIANRNGVITLKNTLLADNLNPDTNNGSNCHKPLASNSFSLSDDFTCGFGSGRDNVNLSLGPLANNRGATQTHLLQQDSPALDKGTGSGCPQIDQRGVTRPQGQACDVGAVELAPTDLLKKVYLPLIQRQ